MIGHELLRGARVVLPDRILEGGWILVRDGKIVDIGSGDQPDVPVKDLEGRWLLPGFVDLHVHGGGGFDVTSSIEAARGAVRFHRGHGTTRTLLSLVTAPLADLEEQLGWVATIAAEHGSGVIGSHLEGPFLSHARCGAQNPEHLLVPDHDQFQRLAGAARGTLRSVTVAPELPGALELIANIVDVGAVAAIGHTDASYEQAEAAILSGATLATHLFNGMRPVHHREPGPVWAALVAGIACEIINDGIHVHPSITQMVAAVPGRLVLVTDAIDAAGIGDGFVQLGGQEVRVQDGQARLVTNGALAGSTLTMDAAVRRAVLEAGIPISIASQAASATPARLLGKAGEFGTIERGASADMVVLNDDLMVEAVSFAGQWTIHSES